MDVVAVEGVVVDMAAGEGVKRKQLVSYAC